MSKDTSDAFNHYSPVGPVTCSSTSGATLKEVTAPDGLLTFNVVEWWGKARLFETTVGHIIIFSGLVFGVIGLLFGVIYTRNNPKVFSFEGQRYELVGVGEIQNGEKKVYAPVYEVKK